MPNTSASGGVLTPNALPAAPSNGDDLDDIFQTLLVGLTGLTGDLVRPRWQPNPAKLPAPSVDWCAIGVTTYAPDAAPSIEHDGAANNGLGVDNYTRHETIEVLASFYGPHGAAYAEQTRDGLAIPQNNEALQLQLMSFVNTDTIRQVPELVNEQWIRRHDLPMRFRRQVKRGYAVQNIVSAKTSISTN